MNKLNAQSKEFLTPPLGGGFRIIPSFGGWGV